MRLSLTIHLLSWAVHFLINGDAGRAHFLYRYARSLWGR